MSSTRLAILACLALAAGAPAQQLNPVYTDDSPVARETLARVAEFLAAKNESEAVRELQRLLDEQPDRLVVSQGDADLFVSVRSRVNRTLLESPSLLALYREAETARAARQLAAGEFTAVERSRLLTAPGFEAALRTAQTQLEAAQFDAALLTLLQLEHHPDRKDQAGLDAAALARTISRYAPSGLAVAQRWAREAGLPSADAPPFSAPPCLNINQTDFFRPCGPLNSEGVPPRPLWSAVIEPLPMPLEPDDAVLRHEQAQELASNLWIFPTVVGDTVYVNDGVFIAARDRFTLQPRWSLHPVSEEGSTDPWAPRRASVTSRLVEDTCTVTVCGHTLVATMGLAQNGDREGDSATFALDTGTGNPIGASLLPRLDRHLDGATVRGPALIDGDTVILAARKIAQGRRIVSLYLVGLSLDNGALRWIRPVGSAGSVPWGGREQRIHSAPALDRGVVYCTDHLGILGAIESATGRPLWIRRDPSPAMGGAPDGGTPWQWSVPLIDGDAIVTLSPDRSDIFRLDRETGRILARRASPSIGDPNYLLRIGDQLACVGLDTVVFIPVADIENGVAAKTPRITNIRGRAVVAGDRLLIPRTDTLATIDPAHPAIEPSLTRLDHLGNVLPLDSQLLVIDSANLHSYLTWTVAQKLLQDRMTASPEDPEPAVTYADLAYRSGHADQIAPAADKALAAIDKAPTAEPMRQARQRLFLVLRTMIEASQDKWAPETRPEPRPNARNANRPPPPAPPELPSLDLKSMALVMDRMGRAANTPDERISHLMALGRLRDAESRPALAAEAYQSILSDPVLAAASWQGRSASVRAETEATRRIRQLLLDRRPSSYPALEAQAAAELAALGPSPAAAPLEKLARQYPAAAAAATAWARAAEQHDAAGHTYAAVSALREGLIAAETVHAAGAQIDAPLLGDIAGRLIVRLQKLDQLFAAAQLISRLRTQYPDLALSDHGTPIDAAAVARDLTARLAGLTRLPRIGPGVGNDPQPLQAWSIMQPRSREQAGRACEHLMLISQAEGRVALWGVAGGAAPDAAAPGGQPGSASHLQLLWSREYKGTPPHLLRLDPDSAYLFWDRNEAGDGPVIERIGAVGGETRWRTEPFPSLFPADAEFDRRIASAQSFDAPIDGTVRLRDFLTSMDEQVLALVERSGRAAAFDLDSGRLLWHAATPVLQVHDVDAGAGAIAIGGTAAPHDGAMNSVIAVFDARTGQLMHTLDGLAGPVRWLRIAGHNEGASLVTGLDKQIDSYDLTRAKLTWSIPGGAAFGSMDAWIFSDQLFILDQHRSLWLSSVANGQLARQPLETYEHLQGSGRIEATTVGKDRKLAAFATDRGVCIFDQTGKLAGIDSIRPGENDEGTLTTPAPSESYFVTLETSPHQTDAGQNVYDLHILDSRTGILKSTRHLALEAPPRAVAILDGRIVVTAGSNTIIYSAPETDAK